MEIKEYQKSFEQIEHDELQKAFLEIQMPRTPYALEKLVVNPHNTEEWRYMQCVLEMSNAYDNLRIAECQAEMKKLEIAEIRDNTEKGKREKKKASIELEQLDRARLGAYREFTCLYGIWQRFPKKYTRTDIDNASPLEYKIRIENQALQDIQERGTVSVGNLEALRQIGYDLHDKNNLIYFKKNEECPANE